MRRTIKQENVTQIGSSTARIKCTDKTCFFFFSFLFRSHSRKDFYGAKPSCEYMKQIKARRQDGFRYVMIYDIEKNEWPL